MHHTHSSPCASSGPAPGNGGGWPSKTGNPSGGGRSNNPPPTPSKNVSTGLLIVSVLCASLLGACGSSAPKWRKSGADSFAAENDLSQCRYEIRTKRLSASEANAALYDCMQAKGYRKR